MKINVYVVDLELHPKTKRWLARAGIFAAILFGGGAAAWAAGLHVWNAGDTLSAADLNTNFSYLQDQINTLQAETHPASAFSAGLSGSPNIPANAQTTVLFNNVAFDLGSEYSTTTGKFTAKNDGYYYVSCQLWFQAASTYQATTSIFKNGANYLSDDVNGMGSATPQSNILLHLASNDYVQCVAYQNSVTSQAIDAGTPNAFSVVRVN